MKIDGAPIIVGGLAMLLRLGMLQTSRIGFVGDVQSNSLLLSCPVKWGNNKALFKTMSSGQCIGPVSAWPHQSWMTMSFDGEDIYVMGGDYQ